MEDAIEYIDEVIDVDDFHELEENWKPEANSVGLLIQKITGVTSPDGKEMITKLKVGVPGIVDLRDVKRLLGLIVLNRLGF